MRVQVQELSKSYGRHPVLRSIDLDLPAGEVVAVLGPNGAGKTTLLRCLGGILLPDEGSIHLDGVEFQRDDLALRRRMAFLPDDVPFDPGMSVLDHAGLVLRLYEVAERVAVQRTLELLERFELLSAAPLPLAQLSRGEKYKAGLIPLMAAAPQLFLLDEPFASGMDPAGLVALKDFLRELTSRGGSALYTTQIMDVVERFADRVVVLSQGRVVVAGTREAVLAERGSDDLDGLFRALREESTS